jgi:leukotriene-A4 hydrolase
MGKTIAVQTFLANREFYHPICAKMVATDLCLAKTNEDVSSSKKKKISLLAVGAAVVLAAAVGMALRRGKR